MKQLREAYEREKRKRSKAIYAYLIPLLFLLCLTCLRITWEHRAGSSPVQCTTKTHAKGAYKTPPRVSFSMQNRGKLPFSWQFTLFVVSSLIAVGICSSLALKSRKPLTIAQKGFLHDKERIIPTDLINEKNDRLHSYERSRSFDLYLSVLSFSD